MPRYTFLLYLLFLPALLMAQGRNFSTAPTPDWLVPYQPDLSRKPDLKDVSDGYYQVLYEEQRHVEKQTIYRHVIRQIVSEVGIQNGSEINAAYNPEYEKLQFHTILIRRNGQIIHQLDPAKFKILQQETELAMFIYSGTYNAYYIVEDVRKGDQIEYAYSITGENPIYQNKYSNTLYFTAYEPIMNFYKSMLVSPARTLHLLELHDAPSPTKKMHNGLQLYEWDLGDKVHVYDRDANLPDWYTGFPHIEISEFSGWPEVAAWGKQVSNLPQTGRELDARIALLKKEAKDDPEQYILDAIRFVQDDIRYMGIEMGEYSHRPNMPEKVCKQRFGDCKDKALLLCALLRANGITANMAYVHTDLRDKTADLLPSPDRFNHVIAQFIFNGKTYWVDATVSNQRGKLSDRYNPCFGKALLLTDTTTGLTSIPIGETGKISSEEIISMPNTRNEYAGMTVRTKYTGLHADNVRNSLATDSRNGLQTSYVDFYKGLYGDVELKDSLEVKDDEVNNIIEVKESYHILLPWKQDSLVQGKYSFNTSAHLLTDKIVAAKSTRKTPLGINYPSNVEQTIQIKFPDNWSLNEEPFSAKTASYIVAFKPELRENVVTLRYQFQTLKDNVPSSDVLTYVRDMNKLEKATSFEFTWTPGAAVNKPESGSPGGLNWMAVVVAIACGALFIYAGKRYYKRSIPQRYHPYEAWEIRGGMILIAIFVLLYPLAHLRNLLMHDNFLDYYWVRLYTTNPGRNISGLQLFMLMEVVLCVFMTVMAVLVAVLFLKRRDLFPRTFSFILIFNPMITVLDYGLADLVLGSHNLLYHNADFIGPLVLAGICIPYLLHSERSKRTFILPYENENGAL